MRAGLESDFHRVARLEDMHHLPGRVVQRDFSDLHLARTPSAFRRLKHVRRRIDDVRWHGGHRVRIGFGRGLDLSNGRRILLCELCLFVAGDVHQVRRHDTLGLAFREGSALVEPQGAIAELLDQVEGMRHEQNRFVPPPELGELVEALRGEPLIPHGENFVDEQDFRVDMDRDRKPEPHVHA
jgi:hypothetical protein